ncbi:MAG: hypothetical protein K0S12_222, partial [Bacteroidetes bacterium]|nr:hypothetical protein [Bacteroidota bacterium]
LIRLPAVQEKILTKTVSFLKNKTKSDIAIQRVGLSFSGIDLEGVLFRDLQNDTLLNAGEISVRLDLPKLIRKQIQINSVSMSDVTGRIARNENDSLYNFNFLIEAFAGKPKSKQETDTLKEPIALSVKEVHMENIRFTFDDQNSGVYFATAFRELDIEVDQFNIDQLRFGAEDLKIDGLKGKVVLRKINPSDSSSTTTPKLPLVSAGQLKITNSSFIFSDEVNRLSVVNVIGSLSVKSSTVNLTQQKISSESVRISESAVRVNLIKQPADTTDNKAVDEPDSEPADWHISAGEVVMENNSFGLKMNNVPEQKNVFDPNHMYYEHISFQIQDAFYSAAKTSGRVLSLKVTDPKATDVKEFSTEFLMTDQIIQAKNLIAKTERSSVRANASISFASMESIGDSIQNLGLQADIRSSSVDPTEILFFAPTLTIIPLFNSHALVQMSGKIKGQLKNLYGNNIAVTLPETKIRTSFHATGIPDIKNSFFDVPSIYILSSKTDIQKYAGQYIPRSIEIPHEVLLEGSFKGRLKEFVSDLSVQSSFGNIKIKGSIDEQENFDANIETGHFNLGFLLNDTKMFGPVTAKAKIQGKGLDTATMKAHLSADVPEIYLNQYTYHNLQTDISYTKKIIEGEVHLIDSAANFDLKGSVNLNKGQEHYIVDLNLKGADLKKLHLHKDDIRIGLNAVADIKGQDMNTVNGTAGITSIVISHNSRKYLLDSLLFAAINEEGNSELKVKSAIVGINYKGTFAPGDLIKELKNNANVYFPIKNLDTSFKPVKGPQNFKFDIELNNHPVVADVFLPDLKEFEPGTFTGSYVSEKKELLIDLSVKKINYKDIVINDLKVGVASDEKKLDYNLTSSKVITSQVKLDNFEIKGQLAEGQAITRVTSTDTDGEKKLSVGTTIKAFAEDYRLSFDPDNFYIMDKKWNVSPDNYVSFSTKGFYFENLKFTNEVSELFITSLESKNNSDIKIIIKNFLLDEVSRIIEKDTTLLKGSLNGDLTLKRVNNSYGLLADLNANDLYIKEIAVGNMNLRANNEDGKVFNVLLKLNGAGNNASIEGQLTPGEKSEQLKLLADFSPITAATFEAFSFGELRECSGTALGKLNITGAFAKPLMEGSLTFSDFRATPAISNTKLLLKNETVKIQPGGIFFNSFTVLDEYEHSAVLNGAVNMKNFKDFRFAMEVNSSDFLLLNTSEKDNEQYFGRMIVDSRIRIRGTLDAPVITSNVKLKNGSRFTFAVTESELTTDKGEGVVLFVDSNRFHPILTKGQERPKQKSGLRNFDISSTVEIDRKATIRLMLDPGTSDSLVVRGDAALSFGIDRSGKISLTGTYYLSEGNYLVSLENLVKKSFKIEPGSTITWNGDPLDADIKINAIYSIRTSPIDLVAGQIPETEKSAYRQRYPFLVYLKLRGAILTPQIDFEIQLPKSEKGALGGTIDAKLEQLNENPSALNKQVFALLVLNRFIQENPLESETDASANAARTTVGKFLSSQLNRLSSKLVPGVDINFDVQSYEDYSSGRKEGRTEVEVGVSKQLFNERVSVQVGGSVDVEGEKAKQNSATDITGDVIVEYKITKDGRYRLKGFRHNQYEGALEGQIIETGAGLLYVRDFEKWRQLLLPEKKDSTNKVYYDKNQLK